MSLIERVQSILLKPKQTWPVIAAESADVASIYTRYVMILAAIPAVAAFIGLTFVGVGAFGVSYRVPIVDGLVMMIVRYVLSLVMVFVLALLVDALAPTFGGTKNQIQALKVVAYGCTAGFVGGIFGLIPSIGILGLLALFYSIYLIYTGLPVLMRCPADKAGAYTAVVIVGGIVAGIVIYAVSGLLTPAGRMGGLAGMAAVGARPGNVAIRAPDGTNVTINPGGAADAAKRIEEAGKRMEAAQKSGDSAATGKAMSEMMGAITGGNATPIAASDLKLMLPDAIGDMKRNSIEAGSGQAMGLGGSTAKASYAAGDRSINLSITDAGGLASMAAIAGWANITMDKETEARIEKVHKEGARTIHEDYRKDGSHGEMTVILANGVIVQADGNRVDVDMLKKTVATIDLGKIETMKAAAK